MKKLLVFLALFLLLSSKVSFAAYTNGLYVVLPAYNSIIKNNISSVSIWKYTDVNRSDLQIVVPYLEVDSRLFNNENGVLAAYLNYLKDNTSGIFINRSILSQSYIFAFPKPRQRIVDTGNYVRIIETSEGIHRVIIYQKNTAVNYPGMESFFASIYLSLMFIFMVNLCWNKLEITLNLRMIPLFVVLNFLNCLYLSGNLTRITNQEVLCGLLISTYGLILSIFLTLVIQLVAKKYKKVQMA